MKFVHITDINIKIWDDFVYNHPNGNFFQTRHFFKLHDNNANSKPIGYAVIENKIVLGVIIGVILKNYIWPVNNFTKRTIIMGGPLIKDNKQEIFEFLMNKFYMHEEKNSIYIQFRNLWQVDEKIFNYKKFGFKYEEHLNLIHDLTEDKNLLYKKISKSKKGNIHKSLNKGTIVKEITDITEYKEGVNLILSTYKRIGLPCPDESFFVNAFRLFNNAGYIKCFGVIADNQLIAMRVEICYKNKIYDWYTGHKSGFKNRYPNDLLPYYIIFWGHENKYEFFDFGGAGKPGVPYGVREHKLKFGGQLVSYGRYEIVNKKFYWFILKMGYNLFKCFRKKSEM